MGPLPSVGRSPREVALERARVSSPASPIAPGGPARTGWDWLRAHPGAVSADGGAPAPHRGRPVPGRRPGGVQELRFGDVVFFNRYCQIGAGVRIWPGGLPGGGRRRCATTASDLGGGRFMHASPRACLSAAWTPRSGGPRTAAPGAISPAAINLGNTKFSFKCNQLYR